MKDLQDIPQLMDELGRRAREAEQQPQRIGGERDLQRDEGAIEERPDPVAQTFLFEGVHIHPVVR